MRATIDLKELRNALRPVRQLGVLSGSVRIAVGEGLHLEGAEFSVTVPCEVSDPGERSVRAEAFGRVIRSLSFAVGPRLEIAAEGDRLRFGSFSIRVGGEDDPEAEEEASAWAEEAPSMGPRCRALSEAVGDGWDVWSTPERVEAIRALGPALVDADAALASFDVTPDDVLELVARKVGTDDVARLRGLIQAATRKHPWGDESRRPGPEAARGRGRSS